MAENFDQLLREAFSESTDAAVIRNVMMAVTNHSVAYVDWDMFAEQYGPTHTNTIEGFWALVKRAILGQWHHVSRKYLPLYLRELAYRYNLRRVGCDLDGVLHLAVNP